ncbi:hypothetical protein SLE2022_014970 [Rubroshorea leprosula]
MRLSHFLGPVDDIPQPSSPPTGGNGNNTTRTIIISVAASLVGILLLVLCIWMFSRRKKLKETVEIETADELIKVESFQYDFATVQAVTNNFCDENKVGEGGFGAVYKAWKNWREGTGINLIDTTLRNGSKD